MSYHNGDQTHKCERGLQSNNGGNYSPEEHYGGNPGFDDEVLEQGYYEAEIQFYRERKEFAEALEDEEPEHCPMLQTLKRMDELKKLEYDCKHLKIENDLLVEKVEDLEHQNAFFKDVLSKIEPYAEGLLPAEIVETIKTYTTDTRGSCAPNFSFPKS